MDNQEIADILHDEVLVELQAAQERDEGSESIAKALRGAQRAIDALAPSERPAMGRLERARAAIAPSPAAPNPQAAKRLGRTIDSSVLASISQDDRKKFGLMGADD